VDLPRELQKRSVAQRERTPDRVLRSRLVIELSEIPPRFRKAVTGMIKELGFTRDEVSELVIVTAGPQEHRADGREDPEDGAVPGERQQG